MSSISSASYARPRNWRSGNGNPPNISAVARVLDDKSDSHCGRACVNPPNLDSGGARVIYLYFENHAKLYLLTLYTKQEQADLTSDQKKAVRAAVEEIKRAHGNPF